MSDLVKVKFIKDRGRRHEGDVVSYDPISAEHLLREGFVEEYVEKVLGLDTAPEFAEVVQPVDPSLPTAVFNEGGTTVEDAVSDDSDPKPVRGKTSRPVKSDEF
ncbi:hypothetical protein EU244_024990 [Rhodococcus qingshengii]|uniref:hypothetical protein n=1 Tax=Rhodococcus qingshengii TaxID=334542 RepID=UPI0010A641F9|nr:hypothetical protein [Rhodococcus qingshengii]THJ70734.1 hypothetical protein EU244_15455 [Rhodococcus qingshengii]